MNVHFINCASVSPVTIVDSSKVKPIFMALHGCHYHVTRVERVYKVRRKCLPLLYLVDWHATIVHTDDDVLQFAHYLNRAIVPTAAIWLMQLK